MTTENDAAWQRMLEEESLSVATKEELAALASKELVCYENGAELQLCAIIHTEQELLDFLQQSALIYVNGQLVPYFVDDSEAFDNLFYYKDSAARTENDLLESVSFDGELVSQELHIFPSHKKDVLVCSHNRFYDKPFRIHKEQASFCDLNDVGVHPEHLEKLPAVVRLYTMDSFDRAGDAKMFELTIAPLKELSSKPLPL